MAIISKNPATGEVNKTFEEISDSALESKIQKAQEAFKTWRFSSFEERDKLFSSLAEVLIRKKRELATLTSMEVGQPIKAALGEVEKCSLAAQFYEGKIAEFLAPKNIPTEATETYVSFEPLGVILGIAPWNYPYWMAFRFIIPTIAAGNTVLLKHSSNVPQCALAIEEVMKEAGFPEGVFQTILVSSSKIEKIIADDRIQGVSFAGSAASGSIVSMNAGKNIKKSLLELGGSDPFIVMEDGDINVCSKSLVEGRLRNAGQACNSPKRVFVHKKIASEFIQNTIERFKNIKMGDPMDETTEIGPLATEQGLLDLENQVSKSIEKGAKLVLGGKRVEGKGNFFEPTILTDVMPGMPVFDQEIFGPVVAITIFENDDELIKMVNNTTYGLGASIWTKDISKAKKLIPLIEAGNVFVNQAVRSDPRLPYGGIKKSGFGRELGEFGIKEFVNTKTILIKAA